VAAFAQVVTTPAVLISLGAVLVCGVLGGLLGSAMLRKHFVRAGLA
jgi:energy-coupling factor transport system substrate-specific component